MKKPRNLFKKEKDELVSHYVTRLADYLGLYVTALFCYSIFNYICGAKIYAIINLIVIVPMIYMVLKSVITHSEIKIRLNQANMIIFGLYFELAVGGIFYFNKHPFLYLWVIFLLLSINAVNFQRGSLLAYVVVIVTFLGIHYVPWLDLSEYSEEIKYFEYWKNINIINVTLCILFMEMMKIEIINSLLNNMLSKNKKLEQFQEEQTNIQKIKDGFFATISHEMRTPLNAIKVISDIIVDKETGFNEINDYNKILKYSSNHLLNLVNDVLDYTKINNGDFSLNTHNFKLEENINLSFNINKKVAFAKNLGFVIKKVSDVPIFVKGDAQRLNQIIMNILSNSIKFTNVGYVSMLYGGSFIDEKNEIFMLNIKIQDTGIGINAENLDKIFEKYFQVKNNQTNSGIGLGLFITKNIIQMMKGTLKVSSQVGIGTIFNIEIPLKVVHKATKENKLIDEDMMRVLSNCKILVAEDNKINQMLIEKLLRNTINNCKTTIVNNGQEAITELTKNSYDIILMDLMMPVLDGNQATIMIRNFEDKSISQIPIIAITANVWENDLQTCLDIGINDFITKPYNVDELLLKISNLIKKN
ncbi:response regulator [Flavobacterium branchiophilum]|uniref:histidine kinase n=1 Tax=Flavobacterium branchiophilum (strain FL-15) TaxID=1034807 RepID=G2Z2Q9_FLABF|nr:response regulator [Flavobacterium branchiophilum]CCB70237.1 Probable hybrid two-component system sensor histidine kinase and response regulator receiver [Flavobacterium branchiophilum FL-15]